MIQTKNVLLISDDAKLFSQLQSLSTNHDYQLLSEEISKSIKPELTICDYHLIPKEVFNHPIEELWLILFDIFDEKQIIHILQSNMKFVVRPFTARVIHEIILSLFRTNTHKHLLPQTISFGDRIFHIFSLKIESPDGSVHLTPSEASILKQLLLHRGSLCLREHLLKEIQCSKKILDRNVDVHIASLRKKLGPYGKYISSVRKIGYIFASRPAIDNT